MSIAIGDLLDAFGVGAAAGAWDVAGMVGLFAGAIGEHMMAIRPSAAEPVTGQWKLCGDNKPYPYIRWDEINTGAQLTGPAQLSNGSTAALGPAPLLTQSQLGEPTNATRKVQWFPRFMGLRIHPMQTDDQDREDLCQSFGDHGSGPSNQLANCITGANALPADLAAEVAGHDFYYWPYVDGFPGYGGFNSLENILYADAGLNGNADSNWADTLDAICAGFSPVPGWCATLSGTDQAKFDAVVLQAVDNEAWDVPTRLGVFADATTNNAVKRTIFAPFYQGNVLNGDGKYPLEEWFPTDQDEANETILSLTSSVAEGGIDAMGATDWSAVIGQTTSNVQCGAASTFTNGGTISNYLGFQQCDDDTADRCAPLTAIIITDGDMDEDTSTDVQKVHKSFAGLRNNRKVKTYVVGFVAAGKLNALGDETVNAMACAATGGGTQQGDSAHPCLADADVAHNFDTCKDPSDPESECAFMAADPAELAIALSDIVTASLATSVPAGAGAAVNTFGTTGGSADGITQTAISARTEWPEWKGHVERELCDDLIEDPANPGAFITAPYCTAADVPVLGDTFGPCPSSRQWDAGECLRQTDWDERKIYITDASNNLQEIYDGTSATAAFVAQLNAGDLAIPGGPYDAASATPIAEFILGKGWKDDWKLPGLAASSPMVVRRVPEPNPLYAPSVGISDPHCAGRLLATPEEVDGGLVDFAEDAWDPALKITGGYGSHYEYQEAVLQGDDLGLLHAFQFDSGNEMWALLPRFALASAVAQYSYGGDAMGQSDSVDEHLYGMSGTVNHGWVHDPAANKWRHLAVVGMGEGGKHLMALDVSHMSPASGDDPVEVLWTSDDWSDYELALGETWARPALTYHIDELGEKPKSYLMIGSGYPDATPTSAYQGRRMLWADALTGEVLDYADLPAPSVTPFESNFGAVVDPAVSTHCVSRFWGEAQEAYIADPAGRLYRWDVGEGKNHESDSGSTWSSNGNEATPVETFYACEGATSPCSLSSSNRADPFLFSPAVVSLNRIDEIPGNSGDGIGVDDQDQFLVAMVSGSPYDDTLDANAGSNLYHPSLYLMVDDHRASKNGGFNITGPDVEVAPGDDPNFMREVITNIPRTRRFLPYPGFAPSGDAPCPNSANWVDGMCEEEQLFSKRVRPIRAPRISVSGLNKLTGCTDLNDPTTCTGSVLETGVEIYTIEFTVYESGVNNCEEGWYDEDNEVWYYDQGASYVISYTLGVTDEDGFDLSGGVGYLGNADGGLKFVDVTQNLDGDCADGSCGPNPGVPSNPPCDPNTDIPPPDVTYTIPLTTSEIEGFTRVQINAAAPPVPLP
jgi:hypothetical protein